MRNLTYYIATTIDGFIAAPDGSPDAFPVTGQHLETIAAEYPETLPVHVRSALGVPEDAPNRRFDTILMGRKTYEPTIAAGFTNVFPHLRSYVFSRSLEIDDPTVAVVVGDPIEEVRRLKQEEGLGIYLCGGADLAGQLLPEIDELVVKCYPFVLGAGIPMFAGSHGPLPFALVDTKTHTNGVVFNSYRRAV